MPYSDYFALRKGYYAVISKHNIEDPQNRWQDTYPHETFVDLVKKTVRMLERPDGNNKYKKPVWIHGAYGTGKTRIAWTLGELLTCPADELSDYFNDYPELAAEKELLLRFQGVKNSGPIVTAMRYDSGDINTLDELVMAIYQCVTEALKKRGLNGLAEKSLAGGILKYLADERHQNMLTPLFSAAPWRHDGALPKTGKEAYEILNSTGDHQKFLGALLRIGREEHIQPFTFSIDSLCEWLKEVIEINNLKALVLIWDEFSSFFRNNRNIYDSFQKLAELSSSAPFYLVIVTHFTSSIFQHDDASAKVIMDRFALQPIDLPEYTAFKLIGHALAIKDGMENEWKEIRDDLNLRLDEARRAVIKLVPKLDGEDLKSILPIHPFAALILKNVAAIFDSNQRSMFEFIAAPDEDAHAFMWFTQTHEPGDLLGIDYLWDYFYHTGKGKQGLGRSNLESQARDILDMYPIIARKYPGDENEGTPEDRVTRRVLKTVIILQALRKSSPDTKFFEATEKNLEIAFEGISELENGIGISAVKRLVDEKVLFIDNEIYQIPMGQAIDQDKILQLVDNTRANLSTDKLIQTFDIWGGLLPSNEALKTRLQIRKASCKDFKKVLNILITTESREWNIKALLLVARSTQEADIIRGQLNEALQDKRANNILFIDATSVGMSEGDYEDLLLARARQQYFTSKDAAQSRLAEQQAEGILRKWQNDVAKGRFALYSSRYQAGKFSASGDELLGRLKEHVLEIYPECCDFLRGVIDSHFRVPNINAIKGGLSGSAGNPITRQQAEMLLGAVRGEKYWEIDNSHPLARLKTEIEKKAKRAFAPGGEGRISIRDIIDQLLKKGFMPTILSSYFTAYLLKEFASPEYRHSDGEAGDVMTQDSLAEMIRDYYQHLNNPGQRYRERYIEVLTREQRAFVGLASRLFGMDEKDSLDMIVMRFGNLLKDWGYPVWVFNDAPDALGLEGYIDLFGQLFDPAAYGKSGYGEVASEIGKLIQKNPEDEARLKKLFTQQNIENGMRAWLEVWHGGEFYNLVREIHVEDPLRDVRDSFDSDKVWLWNRQTGEEAIEEIIQGYKLAAQSMRLGFLSQANSRDACFEGWRYKLSRLHLPVEILRERYPERKRFFTCLADIARNVKVTKEREELFYKTISEETERVREIFDNALDVFKTVYAPILSDLGDNEKDSLYDKLPSSSFLANKNVFEDELRTKAQSLASGLKRSKLLELWREATGSETPADLARTLGTPPAAILASLLSSAAYDKGWAAMEIVNNPNASANAIDEALAYWQGNAELLARIKNQEEADVAFREIIIGKYGHILSDLESVRAAMRGQFGEQVYIWMNNPRWQKFVEGLAAREYAKKGREIVLQKIQGMQAEETRNLLLRLVEDNFEIGMKILSE